MYECNFIVNLFSGNKTKERVACKMDYIAGEHNTFETIHIRIESNFIITINGLMHDMPILFILIFMKVNVLLLNKIIHQLICSYQIFFFHFLGKILDQTV